MPPPSDPLLLSVDFEDWHQLVRRRVGCPGWEQPGPALARQTDALLALLDELRTRATFFVLGMAARAHTQLLDRIVAQGHEIACHGDAHVPVASQTPKEFARDLRTAKQTIEELTGRRTRGYRAPAFSITRNCGWAYEILLEEGFSYDSSQHDSPRLRERMMPADPGPHPLTLSGATLWEFPVAVWRLAGGRVPVGGASYWGVMPTPLVLHGLRATGQMAGLYLHPHELDPQPLRVQLPPRSPALRRLHAGARQLQRNLARRKADQVLRAIARRHSLISYGEAHARLAHGSPTST